MALDQMNDIETLPRLTGWRKQALSLGAEMSCGLVSDTGNLF